MIGEFLLNVAFGIVSGLFALLPDFSWSVDSAVFSTLLSVLKAAGYMFPWDTVLTIVGLTFSISLIPLVVSAIKTLWELLPVA